MKYYFTGDEQFYCFFLYPSTEASKANKSPWFEIHLLVSGHWPNLQSPSGYIFPISLPGSRRCELPLTRNFVSIITALNLPTCINNEKTLLSSVLVENLVLAQLIKYSLPNWTSSFIFRMCVANREWNLHGSPYNKMFSSWRWRKNFTLRVTHNLNKAEPSSRSLTVAQLMNSFPALLEL